MASRTDRHHQSLLLSLPTEVLNGIFSFLTTDTLVNMSLTCHNARMIVAQLPTWSEDDLRFENHYDSSPKLEDAVKPALVVPQRVVLVMGATSPLVWFPSLWISSIT
ncbi:hypothetical protein M427DRAFT_136594 [Gonapodya prolifera JEL478]|uniref:F-box domain-containing protein n=1 Tax=Gonapodya prolifera (strain JEL478) TaxID=1344416 RepID=A0A139A9C9_GONPJ|nr:hypothetical protein M427DRAFT_136594 [Gonapodya prolifera JEL478]|eukprot:KXS13422.1 hypothetical protein M427DRAFT_136594 [Gonapodya prolifera JEL478]